MLWCVPMTAYELHSRSNLFSLVYRLDEKLLIEYTFRLRREQTDGISLFSRLGHNRDVVVDTLYSTIMNQHITKSKKLVLQNGPKQEGKVIDSANKENLVGGSHQNPKKSATALDIQFIRENIIGYNIILDGPFGPTPMVYADATASAKSLAFIEDYIRDVVLPMYANTHTEASATGSQTTVFRNQARAYVHEALGAPNRDYAVVFVGSGSTGAMNKLAHVLGISPIATQAVHQIERPVVFISYYEHHSNELLWRESNVDLVVIPENRETGSLDRKFLESKLIEYQNRPLILASFSAASNVTGIAADF
jgi:hypothetical protein